MVLIRLFVSVLYLVTFVNITAQFGSEKLVTTEIIKSQDSVHPGESFKIAFKAKVKNEWHINSDKPNDEYLIASQFSIPESDNFKLSNIVFPEAKNLSVKFSDNKISVFEGEFIIEAVVIVSEEISVGEHSLNFNFSYQGCNDESCLAPEEIETVMQVKIVDQSIVTNDINQDVFSAVSNSNLIKENNEEFSLANEIESNGILIGLIIVFIGGLALNLTPCVYPLIPITIGYFGGQSEGRTGKLFVLGIMYMLGMALTYSIVGVVTSLSGSLFGSLLQNPIVIIIIAMIFVALSLSMFGFYEFKLPDSWAAKAGGAKSGSLGAFFMGLTMGIVAAPCIGPFVLGLVTLVAAKGDPYFGFLMFFFLALGLGFPYLILALFSGKIKSLPRAGLWMESVKHIFGILLMGMALYYIGPLIPNSINVFLLPIYMILSAIYLFFFEKQSNKIGAFKIFKIIFAFTIMIVGVYFLIPSEESSPEWKIFSEKAYQTSLASNNKIVIDFYADWCIPCKELDALTFSEEKVITLMMGFDNYKVDMTSTMSDATVELKNKFEILGMPTILIINSEGKEIDRVKGFISAEEMFKRLSKAVK